MPGVAAMLIRKGRAGFCKNELAQVVLTSNQSIVSYHGGRAIPDRLTRACHAHYVEYARRMLAVYRSGVGQTRRELHQSVQNILANEPDCDARRVAAFCKLLDDQSEFEKDHRGAAAALRLRAFSLAAPHQPPGMDRCGSSIRAEISREIGRPWPQIAAALYSDVIDFQPLKSFRADIEPEALLSRYNVGQLQACLYRAQSLRVIVSADFKIVLRYAKLARLLHEIHRLDRHRYQIDLTGPGSILSQTTRRYGVNFARFVAALLACKGWEMSAVLQTPWKTFARLGLSDRDGFNTHLPQCHEFDSSVEEQFASDFGAQRDGWTLIREGAILHEGQTTFVPDFVLRHEDGHEVLMEIVGFWTADYLGKKRQTLRRFRQHRIVLAVAEKNLRRFPVIGGGVVAYKKRIDPDAILKALSVKAEEHGAG